MLDGVIEDVHTLDPVAYIRHLGLPPEDSYGFIPTRLEEASELLYLYRDRPEYERARSTPAAPRVEMRLPTAPGGRLGAIPRTSTASSRGSRARARVGKCRRLNRVGRLLDRVSRPPRLCRRPRDENDLWPRARLVIKQTGGQLADSLKEKSPPGATSRRIHSAPVPASLSEASISAGAPANGQPRMAARCADSWAAASNASSRGSSSGSEPSRRARAS